MSAPPVEGEDVPGEASLVEWLRESDRYDPRFALVAVDTAASAGRGVDSAGADVGVSVDISEVDMSEGDVGQIAEREPRRQRGVVGHVMASWGDVDGVPVLGIGPLSVDPTWHGRGVGSALMRELLSRAIAAGERVVVLLGDPAYYERFSFVPASRLGIEADPAWGDFFQACALNASGAADLASYAGPRGAFTYAEPFSRLG